MPPIDLRSDTVSRPTDAMRRAMAAAEVGDDVFGDDPTVIALQERAAELLGKEAALFVSSGSMGNLVSLVAHLPRGHEAIAGFNTHVVMDEQGGHAVIVGSPVRALPDRPDGTMDPDQIRGSFRDPDDAHEAITGLIVIENTHAATGGQPLSLAYEQEVASIAHERGVPLHIDGARFFNAVIANGVSPKELAAPGDTVTFCLSKGLGCPIGSIVVGPKDVIRRAWRARKLVGGGTRQAGILAAAGLLALKDGDEGMIARLADDHANARRLGEAISAMDGIRSPGHLAQPGDGALDPGRIRTNFVLFRVERDRKQFLAELKSRGVLMVEYPHDQVRAVTHHNVSAADIETTIAAVADSLRATRPRPLGAGAMSAAPARPAPTPEPVTA
jgi:threonine aldolase